MQMFTPLRMCYYPWEIPSFPNQKFMAKNYLTWLRLPQIDLLYHAQWRCTKCSICSNNKSLPHNVIQMSEKNFHSNMSQAHNCDFDVQKQNKNPPPKKETQTNPSFKNKMPEARLEFSFLGDEASFLLQANTLKCNIVTHKENSTKVNWVQKACGCLSHPITKQPNRLSVWPRWLSVQPCVCGGCFLPIKDGCICQYTPHFSGVSEVEHV